MVCKLTDPRPFPIYGPTVCGMNINIERNGERHTQNELVVVVVAVVECGRRMFAGVRMRRARALHFANMFAIVCKTW